MKIVVTGANGMIGANLVRMLLARGDQVKGLVYGDTRSLAGLNMELAPCPLLDKDLLRDAIAGAEMVFHLASVITLRSKTNPSAEQMVQLITDLLDISAIESGKINLDMRPNNLITILDECERIHHKAAQQKNINLNILKDPLPEISFDKERIFEVVDNLLSTYAS